jgi:hypothetical protein
MEQCRQRNVSHTVTLWIQFTLLVIQFWAQPHGDSTAVCVLVVATHWVPHSVTNPLASLIRPTAYFNVITPTWLINPSKMCQNFRHWWNTFAFTKKLNFQGAHRRLWKNTASDWGNTWANRRTSRVLRLKLTSYYMGVLKQYSDRNLRSSGVLSCGVYRRFGTTYRSHHKRSRVITYSDSWP